MSKNNKKSWIAKDSFRKDGSVRLPYKYRNGRAIRGIGTWKEMQAQFLS